MLLARSRRKALGFALIEILTVTSIISGLQSQSSGTFRYAISKANEIVGINNLKQVYLLLQAQMITEGYPKAAFYPKGDPKTDPQSIVRLVQGAPPQLFVSPFAPPALKEKGLTYAWNDTVNGKQPDAVPGNTWLMIDVVAFVADPKVERPSKYLVLYADGKAEAVTTLPADIVKAVKEAQEKLKEKE